MAEAVPLLLQHLNTAHIMWQSLFFSLPFVMTLNFCISSATTVGNSSKQVGKLLRPCGCHVLKSRLRNDQQIIAELRRASVVIRARVLSKCSTKSVLQGNSGSVLASRVYTFAPLNIYRGAGATLRPGRPFRGSAAIIRKYCHIEMHERSDYLLLLPRRGQKVHPRELGHWNWYSLGGCLPSVEWNKLSSNVKALASRIRRP